MDCPSPSVVRTKQKNNVRIVYVRRQSTKVMQLSRCALKAAQKQQPDGKSRKRVDQTTRGKPILRLLALPRELRDEMYDWVMLDWPSGVYVPSNEVLLKLALLPQVLPGICFVNKQLLLEARLAFIRRARFRLQNDDTAPRALETWLSQFPGNQGFQAMHFLKCDYIKPLQSLTSGHRSRILNLLSQCNGLRGAVIEIQLIVYELEDKAELERKWTPLLKLSLPNLRHFKVSCQLLCTKSSLTDEVSAGFGTFMQMFEQGFATRDSPVVKKFARNAGHRVCELTWPGPQKSEVMEQ